MSSGDAAMLPKPIIELPLTIVRPYKLSDTVSLQKVANNPNVSRNLRNIFPSPYTIADAQFWVDLRTNDAEDNRYYFALADPVTGDVMGGITATPEADVHCRSAELGYWLGEEHWGKGIMSEVVPPFISWAFANVKVEDKDGEHLGLTRIYAAIYDGNKGSEGVLKKAGFEYEGRLRQSVWKHGKVIDQLLYAMTRDDWEKKNGT